MQKSNVQKEQKEVSICGIKIFGIEDSIKLASKYLSYLSIWRKKCSCKIWMTDYADTTPAGHFSVITTGRGERKKFLVGLDYLSYPPFVRLLEAAEREFGFEQKGVLAIPCEASELQNILLHL